MPRNRRRVLITGAGSGIGRELAIRAAAAGHHIALCGRRSSPLHDTLSLLPGDGHMVLPADITIPIHRQALAERIAQSWGGLDVLVNNAGVVPGGPFERMGDSDMEAAVATNLLAPMALTRELLPLLRRGHSPRVVNVGSMLGEIPYPLFAAYSATKAGLSAFSTALRRELAVEGIGVTHAAPRATRTRAAAPFEALAQPFGMRFDPPERVAERIWSAVERGRDVVWPGLQERFFVLLQRLFPGLVDRATVAQLKKAKNAIPSLFRPTTEQ